MDTICEKSKICAIGQYIYNYVTVHAAHSIDTLKVENDNLIIICEICKNKHHTHMYLTHGNIHVHKACPS